MSQFDDEMLPEYDFSQLGQPVRGKHAKAMRQGYSVTIHHPDGTITHREVSPRMQTRMLPFITAIALMGIK